MANELEYTEYKAFGKTPAQLKEFLVKVRSVLSSDGDQAAAAVAEEADDMLKGFKTGFKAYYEDGKEEAIDMMKKMYREDFDEEMDFLERGEVYLDQGHYLVLKFYFHHYINN